MALNHIVNGSPVEVKHIRYGTAVGYTKVGSPTITNGVVSGFSQGNYIKTSSAPVGQITSFEQNISFIVPQDTWSSNGYISCYKTNRYGSGSNLFGGVLLGNEQSSIISAFLFRKSDDTYQKYSLNYDFATHKGEKFTFKISTDMSNVIANLYNSAGNVVATNSYSNQYLSAEITSEVYFGAIPESGGFSDFTGSVDLNNTYIKVNGKLWFYQPSTNYLIKDDKLVFADNGLYLTGPVNYTIQGAPNIVDGMASNFSANNYLRLSQQFSVTQGEDFEIFFKCEIPTNPPERSCLFSIGYDGVGYGAGIYIETNNKPAFACYALGGISGNALTQGQVYYIKAGRANGTTYLSVSQDKVNWETQYGTSANMNNAWGNPDPVLSILGHSSQLTPAQFFHSYIDLNETYITKAGALWFYGKNYASPNIAPVPSGFTYGNITTSAIGFVDMRTQAFTPAPSGATIGKDE